MSRRVRAAAGPKRGALVGATLALALALALALLLGVWRVGELAEREARARLAALEASVGERLNRARDLARVPGLSAAFALPDGRVGVAVTGYADVEAQAPMTPATRFIAGSVGKSFHAALALLLHREGTLDLDAPIARWIGDEPWFRRLPNADELTLRHLLQHQSGLIDHIWSPEFFLLQLKTRLTADPDRVLAPEELLDIALDREPRFPAGEGFAYGDTNYVLAGLAIERATGRGAFEQIEERLLRPLGLAEIVPARARHVPRLAAGYQMPLNLFLLPPKIAERGTLRFHPMNESTAGGFATTPRELVRWAVALFEERALPAPYLDDLVGRSVAAPDGRRYGLGVYLQDTPLGEAWGHGGFFPGYRSTLLYLPKPRIAVCVQANRDFLVDVDALALDIARLIAEHD